MGAYTCTKPATFAGVKYKPGDTVPVEAIPADRVGAVIRLGLIAEQREPVAPEQTPAPVPPATIPLPISMEGGNVEQLETTPENIIEAVTVLQMTADAAMERIKAVTDVTALIVIDACDSRKTVKKAAADRAAELDAAATQAAQGGAGSQGGQEPPEGEKTPQSGQQAAEGGE